MLRTNCTNGGMTPIWISPVGVSALLRMLYYATSQTGAKGGDPNLRLQCKAQAQEVMARMEATERCNLTHCKDSCYSNPKCGCVYATSPGVTRPY